MDLQKKIAVLCDYRLMPERVGGMDRFYWLFDKQCKGLDYEVTWFFPNMGFHGEYGNLSIVSSEGQPLESYFLEYINEIKTNYDIVITHFLELCTPFFKKIKTKSVGKVIAVDHNPRPVGGYALKKKINKRIKGFLYANHVDTFVCVSEYTRSQILKDFGKHLEEKTVVVHNGVLTELFRKRENRSVVKPSFLVACHLRESKGVQDLILAVFLLSEDIKKEIKIDIYGDGPYKNDLLSEIKRFGVEKNFVFKGSVSNLFDVYCQYDYLIHPSREETFCYTVIESMAANVPPITTECPGGNVLKSIKNGKNGYIFESKDVSTLKEILENLFLGKIEIKGSTATLIETRFSIEKMVKEHVELL